VRSQPVVHPSRVRRVLPHRAWTVLALMLTVAACTGAATPAPSPSNGGSTGASPVASDMMSESPGEIRLIHEAGVTVLQEPATNVAVLQWQFAETLLALDVQPAAMADEQQAGSGNPFPTLLEGKFSGYVSLGSRTSPNLEVLASTPVDLIVADRNEHLANYETFKSIAPTLILDTNDYAKLYSNFEVVAKAMGLEDKAAAIEAEVKENIASVREEHLGQPSPKGIFGIANTENMFLATGGSFWAGVLKDVGADYAYPPGGATADMVSLEQLASMEFDVLIVAANVGDPIVVDGWAGNATWENIPAVASGHYFRVDRNIWSTPRGVISTQEMVKQAVSYLYGA
jgi:ferric citrate transport system substrate-binding protein